MLVLFFAAVGCRRANQINFEVREHSIVVTPINCSGRYRLQVERVKLFDDSSGSLQCELDRVNGSSEPRLQEWEYGLQAPGYRIPLCKPYDRQTRYRIEVLADHPVGILTMEPDELFSGYVHDGCTFR
jgi:hypothetical protein